MLKEAYKDDFIIGAAVNPGTMDNSDELITAHFSGITPENIMKPGPIHPSEKSYRFDNADRLMDYASERDMTVHGHVLVWHNQTGRWMFRDGYKEASAELLDSRMGEHIRTVVGRYRGRIKYWDVVNEAISDSGGFYREDSPWFEIMGPDFIEKAFIYAHEADPDARLYYNDYNVVDPAKRNKIYVMAKELLDKGVPLHGIGIQGHWSLRWPEVSQVEETIDLFAGLGLEVQITELDLSFYEFGDKDISYGEPPEELIRLQAERYGALFELFHRKRDVLKGVTTWGVADDYTWLDNFPVQGRKNWPLLFDERGEPKPALERVLRAARDK